MGETAGRPVDDPVETSWYTSLSRSPAQNTPGVPGASEKGDDFGATLAVADLNRDGSADIVVGSPLEDMGETDVVQVTVVPGRRTGSLGTGAYAYTQDAAGIPGAGGTGASFDAATHDGTSPAHGGTAPLHERRVQRSRRARSTRSSVWCAPAPPSGATRGRCSFTSTFQSSSSRAATIEGQT